MALEAAYQQDLYPLFLETATYDNNYVLPNFSLENQDLDLLNDCCYGLINHHNNVSNDFVWDYCHSISTTLSPPDQPEVGVVDNIIPTLKIISSSSVDDDQQVWAGEPNKNSSSPEPGDCYAPVVVTRPKRRRTRARKNQEDIENQRMTHIAVERNRRKQMNDYLAVLRSLMPHSYVQRGDQASIVGGAINFVKELEQNLQCLSARKQTQASLDNGAGGVGGGSSAASLPFGEFFTFPQYSTEGGVAATASESGGDEMKAEISGDGGGAVVADVEVTMVESHALVKIRSKKPPKQLSKLVMGLQGLRLTILHLNLTKLDGVALYSFSVKVEDESKLGSVDEIAGAVYQLLGRIQDEANLNS